jgi:type VII secretion integral membrane protein EccD
MTVGPRYDTFGYALAMPAASTGLAHVTINAPDRRVDVALPDSVPLAELQADLLRHAGVALPDQGQKHGGWLLRRADGTPLSPTTGLAGQGIRDGAVLHLVPAGEAWPEFEYDDVVEAIADGARRYGLGWSPLATRIAALVAGGLALALALWMQWRADGPAVVALVLAAALLAGGSVSSRAYGDASLGAVLAGAALPFAFVGGWQLAGGRLLTGSALLLLVSVLAAIGVVHVLRLFVAGATTGLLGVVAALLTGPITTAGAAGAILAALVAGVAGVPLLAIRLGKLPMPSLDLPVPDRASVFAAVARTDEMLTGMVSGIAAAAVVAAFVLARTGDVTARVLVAVAAAAFLLRARLFVTVRQRLPLVAAGLVGFGLLAVFVAPPGAILVSSLAVVGVVVALAGRRYAMKAPSPYIGRAADIVDALCVVSVIPIAAAVLGVYGLAADLVS